MSPATYTSTVAIQQNTIVTTELYSADAPDLSIWQLSACSKGVLTTTGGMISGILLF